MRTTLPLVLLLLIMSAGCRSGDDNASNEEKLKRFYSWYLTANDGLPPGQKISRDTLEKYCTEAFLKNVFDDTDLDYDPIISGRDYDKDWVNTIMVTKATAGSEKEYRVSYLVDKQHTSHNIVVTMGKEAGEWKIDYVKDNE